LLLLASTIDLSVSISGLLFSPHGLDSKSNYIKQCCHVIQVIRHTSRLTYYLF
jgi:hypothetical protein